MTLTVGSVITIFLPSIKHAHYSVQKVNFKINQSARGKFGLGPHCTLQFCLYMFWWKVLRSTSLENQIATSETVIEYLGSTPFPPFSVPSIFNQTELGYIHLDPGYSHKS